MADLIPPTPETPPRVFHTAEETPPGATPRVSVATADSPAGAAPRAAHTAEGSHSLTSLLSGIVDDLQRLLRQEMLLARREVQQEWEKAKVAAGAFAAGAFLGALAAVMLCFFLVYLLSWATGLNLWAWFLIVGFILGAAALGLIGLGWSKSKEIHVVPPQTAETMKENVEWIQTQT